MGGAPSLEDHLAQVEADVFISVNAHGASHRHDYIVAMDEEHGDLRVPMGPFLRQRSKAPVIGPRAWNDFVLSTWPDYPKTGVLSGMVAAWVAWAMGAKVVILAGMDGYGGQPSSLARCAPAARDVRCPVRVVGGGPLTKFWPTYDPSETFGEYVMHPSIEALQGVDTMTRVKALKKCSTATLNLQPGEEVAGMRHEFARLLKHRLVEEIPMPVAAPAPAPEPEPAEPEQDASPEDRTEDAPPRRGRPRKSEA